MKWLFAILLTIELLLSGLPVLGGWFVTRTIRERIHRRASQTSAASGPTLSVSSGDEPEEELAD